MREYKALGYYGWAKKTGYFRKRFSEEHAFGMLIAKYGDEVPSRTTEMAAKDVLSRLMLHNLHAFLYYQSPLTEGIHINPNREGGGVTMRK